MHPNPTYRATPDAQMRAFASERAFGTLAVNADPAPLLSHIPFVLTGDVAELHLVRSNPIARLGGAPAVLSVTGPDGYISPDWYGLDDQVPTWNYIAVHLRGTLEPLPVGDLPGVLERLSDVMERRLAPKPVWTMDKMDPGARDRMLRQILPFRLRIDRVEGTWKLGQNKPGAARLSAAAEVTTGVGSDLEALRGWMRDLEG